MGRLDGKVCVITGAASGIGAETAALFRAEGARVVGVDLSPHSAADLAIQADVTDAEQVEGVYTRAREEFGRIDVLSTTRGSRRRTTCRCSRPRSRPGSVCRT